MKPKDIEESENYKSDVLKVKKGEIVESWETSGVKETE